MALSVLLRFPGVSLPCGPSGHSPALFPATQVIREEEAAAAAAAAAEAEALAAAEAEAAEAEAAAAAAAADAPVRAASPAMPAAEAARVLDALRRSPLMLDLPATHPGLPAIASMVRRRRHSGPLPPPPPLLLS
jgi:hypothetical protein